MANRRTEVRLFHQPKMPMSRHITSVLAIALAAIFAGCNGALPVPTNERFAGLTLSVAALGNSAILDAVRVQAPEWESQTGAKLSIQSEPIKVADANTFNVLIFPGDLLGALVDGGALRTIRESAVRPVDTEMPDGDEATEDDIREFARRRDPLDFNDVAQPYREQVTKYGDDRYALPLGGTALVLLIRRDALQLTANQTAAKQASVALKSPSTWAELDTLARFFQGRDWNADGQPDHGIAIAFSDDETHVGEDTFLSRAAALGQPPDQFAFLFDAETLEPRLSQPPFVEALDGIASLQSCGPPEMNTFDADAARAAFRDGRAAMLIDRAEFARTWTDPKAPFAVEVSELPGSPRVYDPARQIWLEPREQNRVSYLPAGGGWLAGIGANATDKTYEAAISFIQSLASPETSQAIVSDPAFPMTPIRTSHLALGLPDPRAALGVDSRAWGKAVDLTFTAPRSVVGLRIPDADGYLDDLGRALRAVLRNEKSADAALQEAANAWNKRSRNLGRARQLWHYRRSVNRLSTTSTPPERGDAP